jgi:hypothetical protein
MDKAGVYGLIFGLATWNFIVVASVAGGGIAPQQAPAVLGAMYVAAAIYLSFAWRDVPHPAAYGMMYVSGIVGFASIFANESTSFWTFSLIGAELAIFAAVLKLIDDRRRIVAKERLTHRR